MMISSAIDFQGAAVPAQQNSRQPVHHVLAVELMLDSLGHHSGKEEERQKSGS